MTHVEQQNGQEPGAGRLGLTRRSYGRLYYNARRILENVDYFVNRMTPWASVHVEQNWDAEKNNRHRRIVGRFLMTKDNFFETMRRSSAIRENIEAVIPVGEYNASPVVMAMWGINNHEEQTNDPINVIQNETEYDEALATSPSVRVQVLRQQGYRFVESADFIPTDDILSLWGPIFEWSRADIEEFKVRLRRQRDMSPEHRSVWFTAIMDGQDVVALAMAERLDMPLGDGEAIPIIESTEWCVRNGWQHRGLGNGAPSHVHAQVITDLRSLERSPVIIAETNYTSRADRNGHNSGMIVAPRMLKSFSVSQVLRQNVAIGDGLRPERLRDFTMMYISSEGIRDYYSPEQCRQILGRDI